MCKEKNFQNVYPSMKSTKNSIWAQVNLFSVFFFSSQFVTEEVTGVRSFIIKIDKNKIMMVIVNLKKKKKKAKVTHRWFLLLRKSAIFVGHA